MLHSRSARRGGVFLHSAISTPILLFIPLSNSRNVATNTSKKVYQAFMPIFDTENCWDVEIIRYLIRCTYCCCYQVETILAEICSSPFSASDNAVSDRDVHTLNYLAHAEIPLVTFSDIVTQKEAFQRVASPCCSNAETPILLHQRKIKELTVLFYKVHALHWHEGQSHDDFAVSWHTALRILLPSGCLPKARFRYTSVRAASGTTIPAMVLSWQQFRDKILD